MHVMFIHRGDVELLAVHAVVFPITITNAKVDTIKL